MNTSEMRANEKALREEKVTAASNFKFGLIRILIWRPFSQRLL